MSRAKIYDVFVSYSAKDSGWVRKVVQALEKKGLSVWHAETMLKPGMGFATQVRQALRSSRVVVVFLSPHSLGSNWAAFETGMAMGLAKPVISVAKQETPRFQLPVPFRSLDILKAGDPESLAEQLSTIVRRERHDS